MLKVDNLKKIKKKVSFSMKELKKKLQKIFEESQKAFPSAKSSAELYELKVKYLGSKSEWQKIIKEMKNLPQEDKPIFGQWLNEKKQILEDTYKKLFQKLSDDELQKKLLAEKEDLSLPGPSSPSGALHPVQQMVDRMTNIFKKLGYSVRTGPLIESDWYNFQALNIPKNHPSRDLQDTFYIDETYVLRTHTSPIQVRTMEQEKLPLAILAPGKVFRRDNDISHSPVFHQMEGMLIDKNVSMAHLKSTLAYFVRELFGSATKVRFRPSYFPFTEPSAEYDCSCPICQSKGCSMCKQSGWVEIGGCGLIHPEVLSLSHINSNQWEGFAFGLGVERLAIIYYGIPHIRLFLENDLRFLKQFPDTKGL